MKQKHHMVMLQLEAKIEIKTISTSQLLESYDYKKVLGYCAECGNLEKNHSCPTHLFDPKTYVSQYEYVAVIMTKIDTQMMKEHLDTLIHNHYPSNVYKDYKSRKPEMQLDWYAMLSMYAFNQVKDDMAGRLLDAEKAFGGCVSLPPGACTRCEVCLKHYGQPCCEPEKLRYSLEALGFLVSDIYLNVFGKTLEWASGELPDAFTTCSAILSKEPINQSQLLKVIGTLILEV